jgi:LysR family transcriptional activator of nhaA
MKHLNYQHLLYFWMVAREGSVTDAARLLHLSQPTISGQLKTLERSLGVKLFRKQGRRLVLTDQGRLIFRYADEIFSLGRELTDALSGSQTGRPSRLTVGIADTLPKLVVHRLLEPTYAIGEALHLICVEGPPEELLAQLALHRIDLALLDMPAPPTVNVRVFSHLLGESELTVFGAADLADRFSAGFPQSLHGSPFLLPGEQSVLRRSLEQWFDQHEIRPVIRGEFADSALLKVFGQAGVGLFVAPSVTQKEVEQQFQVRALGKLDGLQEQFFAVSIERKLRHPAVIAISQAAKKRLFR